MNGYGTYLVAAGTLVYAVVGYLLHYLDGVTALGIAAGALGLGAHHAETVK